MIKVTRLGGKPFYLNSDLIESLESSPDTTLVLTNGKRVIVREAPEDVIARIVEFRQRIAQPEPAPPSENP
jgi:flagellar protein FlbD